MTSVELDERIAAIEQREPKRLELPHRETEIAMILTYAFDCDREVQRGRAALRTWLGCDPHAGATTIEEAGRHAKHDEPERHLVTDLVGTALPTVYAQLATVLMGPVTRLVDQCLDVAEDWRWFAWSEQKQSQRLERLFREAGISERFVDPGWAPDPAAGEATSVTRGTRNRGELARRGGSSGGGRTS